MEYCWCLLILTSRASRKRSGWVNAALQSAVGPGGLWSCSMTDDDEHIFEPERTPCLGMGVVADTFWRLPGVLRIDSPHAFAASRLQPA